MATRKRKPDIVDLDAQMQFDRSRAVEVFPSLIAKWGETRYTPPEVMHLPEEIERGSRTHALWLWLSLFGNRYGQTADDVFRRAADVVLQKPHLADPLLYPTEPLCDEDFALLAKVIPFAAGQPELVNDWWQASMQRIRQLYAGDPRYIFLRYCRRDLSAKSNGPYKRRLIIDELCQFKGIQHKLAQLGLIFFKGVDWAGHGAAWQELQHVHAMPVDIWMLRMLYQWGILQSKTEGERLKNRQQVSGYVSDLICDLCWRYDWDSHALAQVLWHTGARDCKSMRQARNGSAKAGMICFECPANDWCTSIVPASDENGGYIEIHLAMPRQPTLFYTPEEPRA